MRKEIKAHCSRLDNSPFSIPTTLSGTIRLIVTHSPYFALPCLLPIPSDPEIFIYTKKKKEGKKKSIHYTSWHVLLARERLGWGYYYISITSVYNNTIAVFLLFLLPLEKEEVERERESLLRGMWRKINVVDW